MRIGLIQVDGKLPNLALMKLSAFYKAKGDEVELILDVDTYLNEQFKTGYNMFTSEFDKVYAAVIFNNDVNDTSLLNAKKLETLGVDIGGTGWSLEKKLAFDIEAMKPDYSLYGIDYGIGFLSKGCIRRCGPCVVWRKEGYIHHVAWPEELINPNSKEIVVLDGLFNGSPYWEQKARWFIDNDYKIDVTQGMDIRLITKESAQLIVNMKHSGYIHFAFDHIDLESEVRKGIELLLLYSLPYKFTFYVIVNYDSTIEQDLKRIAILEEYGVNPYVMVYNKTHAPQEIRDLQRWCNSIPPIRKVCKFEDYDWRKFV